MFNVKDREPVDYIDLEKGKVYLQVTKNRKIIFLSEFISKIETSVYFEEKNVISFGLKRIDLKPSNGTLNDYLFYIPTQKELNYYNKCVKAGKYLDPKKYKKKTKLKKHRLYAKVNYLGLKIEKLEKELKELKTQKTVSRLKQIKEKIDKRKADREHLKNKRFEKGGIIETDNFDLRSYFFGEDFLYKPNNKLTAEKVEIGKWYKDGEAYLCPFKYDHLNRVFICFGFGARCEIISEITLSEDVVEVSPKDVKSLFYLHEKTYKPNV